MDNNEGLIFSYVFDGKGGGSSFTWEGIKNWSPDKGTIWLHLNYKNEKVRTWLKEQSGLSPVICEALIEEETRPRIVVTDEGILLILRGVNFNPGSDPEDMVSLRMWFDKNRIITMRQRKVMAIDDIHKAIESKTGPISSSDLPNVLQTVWETSYLILMTS